MNSVRTRARRILDHLVSTRGILLFMGMIMAGMTISTAENYRLDNIPFRGLLLILSTCATVIAIGAAWFRPTQRERGWVGVLWMLYFGLRGLSFAWRVAARTDGLWGFIKESNSVLTSLVGMFLGLLVFARRRLPPHTGSHDVKA